MLAKTAAALQLLADIVRLIVKLNQAYGSACESTKAHIGSIERPLHPVKPKLRLESAIQSSIGSRRLGKGDLRQGEVGLLGRGFSEGFLNQPRALQVYVCLEYGSA